MEIEVEFEVDDGRGSAAGAVAGCADPASTGNEQVMLQRIRRYAARGFLLSLLLAGACAAPSGPEALRALYLEGRTFQEYLEAADFRQDEWQAWYADAEVPDSLLARARAVPGTWRILAISADWCGDSIRNLPYLARLAEQVDGLELRFVSTGPARRVQAGYRAPDGRVATPTVLMLNDAFEEKGCWIERPAELQSYYLANKDSVDEDALHDHMIDWYEDDRGVSVLAEIVERLEAAAAGSPVCEGKVR